jgi:hypothetical protein
MSLLAKPVNCDCPKEMVIAILDTLPGSVEMAACLRCGKTDLANPVVSEDRPHDVQMHGYNLIELSDDARKWASAWPRYAVVNRCRIYLSAASRFASAAERDIALSEAAAWQSGATLRDTLLRLGIPGGGPPASLPKHLAGFVQIWDGLQLNDNTPVEELLDAATRFNGPHRLAAEVLARRSDLDQLAIRFLWDPDNKLRTGGRYLVEQFHLEGIGILAAVQNRLEQLDDDKTGELGSIATLLWTMGKAALYLLPDLERTADRVKPRDYYAHKRLVDLMEILRKMRDAN